MRLSGFFLNSLRSREGNDHWVVLCHGNSLSSSFHSLCNQNPGVYGAVTVLVPISCCLPKENHKPTPTGLWFGKERNVHSETTQLSHKVTGLAGCISSSTVRETHTSCLLQWPTSKLHVCSCPAACWSWLSKTTFLRRMVCKSTLQLKQLSLPFSPDRQLKWERNILFGKKPALYFS